MKNENEVDEVVVKQFINPDGLKVKDIVKHIVDNAPLEKFKKTIRGVCFNDSLEFIFATDKEVKDDFGIIVKGVDDHFVYSPEVRNRLVEIFHKL